MWRSPWTRWLLVVGGALCSLSFAPDLRLQCGGTTARLSLDADARARDVTTLRALLIGRLDAIEVTYGGVAYQVLGGGAEASVVALRKPDGTFVVVKIGFRPVAREFGALVDIHKKAASDGKPVSVTRPLKFDAATNSFSMEPITSPDLTGHQPFVPAMSLRDILRNSPGVFGQSKPERTELLIAKIKEAAKQMHAIGWVHRDIKPENILVSVVENQLCVTLADCGIARRIGRLGPFPRVEGTFGYMSPNQLAGGEGQPGDDDFAIEEVVKELRRAK